MNKPVIGLMLGDATGIGPEISAKLLASGAAGEVAHVIVIGDRRVLDLGLRDAGVNLAYRAHPAIDSVRWPSEPLPVLEVAAPAQPGDELPDLAESWAWAHAQVSWPHDTPPDDATTAEEISQLMEMAAQRDDAALVQIAYWNAGAPSYRWNQIALEALLKRGTPANFAFRDLALVHVAIYDATVAAWDSKFAYNRPRPSEVNPALTTAMRPRPRSGAGVGPSTTARGTGRYRASGIAASTRSAAAGATRVANAVDPPAASSLRIAMICSGVLPSPRTTSGNPVRRWRWVSTCANSSVRNGSCRSSLRASSTPDRPAATDSSNPRKRSGSMSSPDNSTGGSVQVRGSLGASTW